MHCRRSPVNVPTPDSPRLNDACTPPSRTPRPAAAGGALASRANRHLTGRTVAVDSARLHLIVN